MTISQNVSILFWNVDGMIYKEGRSRCSKLDEDAIRGMFIQHDIVCLVETHCSYSDQLHIDDYSVVVNVRPKSPNAKKHSGGIAIFAKKNLRPGITFLSITSSEYMWLKLDKKFFNMETDIYLLVVYVAPLNSSFAVKSEDLFQLIENDISKLSSIGQILVCGDFNARTSKEPDYCTHDNISDLIDIPVTYTQDIPIHRNNLDVKSVDHHGNQLLELCRSSDMRIVNGRVFGDTLGYHTCFSPNGDPSVIDYFLTSSNMLKNILSLKVYDPSYHSIHCALSLCLQTPRYSIPSIKDICSPLAKFKWHPSFKTHLQSVLSSPLYQEMLSQIQQKCCSINSNDVDSISIDLVNVLTRAASQAGVKKTVSKRRNLNKKTHKKPWYNAGCRSLKRSIQAFNNRLRKNPYEKELRMQYFHLKKQYKQYVKRVKNDYESNLWKTLEGLNNRNPKAFWEMFNKFSELEKQHKKKIQFLQKHGSNISNLYWTDHLE